MRTLTIFLLLVVAASVCDAQWVQQNSGTGAQLLGVSFVSPSTGWVVGYDYDSCAVLKTSNSGVTWTKQVVPRGWNRLHSVQFLDSSTGIAVGGLFGQGTGWDYSHGVILRTTDGGTTWGIVSPDTTWGLQSVTFKDTVNGWAVGGNESGYGFHWVTKGVILHTTDGGRTWIVQYADSIFYDRGATFHSVCFADINNGIAVAGSRILRTTNGGATWARQTWTDTIPYNLSFNKVCFQDANNGLIFGSDSLWSYFLLRTADAGETWAKEQYSALVLDAVFVDANIGIAVGDSGKILRTSNGGATWTNQLSSMMNRLYGVSFTDANTGTVVGDSGTILHTTNGGITWVEGEQRGVPQHYLLSQNYPNPFNPSSTIRYALPQTSFVTLTIYNTLGQQVAQLVNEQQQAGYHDAVFRGDGLGSGVYYYRLQAGNYVETKKLLLLR